MITPVESAENRTPDTEDSGSDVSVLYLLLTVLLWSMGATLLLISLAYIKDIDTLKNIPDAVWNFICGRPTPDGPTLPLLLTLGTLALLSGGGVLLWSKFLQKRVLSR